MSKSLDKQKFNKDPEADVPSELESFLNRLSLPIEHPLCLYFKKEGRYVDSFDPVTQIEVWSYSVNIKNGRQTLSGEDMEYNLSFDVFDEVELINEEQDNE